MLTNYANKQNSSFWNLLNRLKTGDCDMSHDMGFPTMWSKMTFSLFAISKTMVFRDSNLISITIDYSAEKLIPTVSSDVMKIVATST